MRAGHMISLRLALLGAATLVALTDCKSSPTDATPTPVPTRPFTVLAGGNNVQARFSSDLWVYGGYAYTGTWNWIERTSGVASRAALNVFQLGATGAPSLVDSLIIPNITTVSDVEVSPDGKWLVLSAEGNTEDGLYVYDLADPAHPVFKARYLVDTGLHTASLATLGGVLYAFTAKNPASPALMVFDLSQLAADTILLTTTVPVAANYGLHDTFIRDGIAFLFAWNTGALIYDVGGGSLGGSPANPVLIGTAVSAGGEVHNGWWYHGPGGSKRYLFIGQEGPGSVGSSSSGDIHVVDVSSLSAPVEVASYHMPGAGTHNFWVDESREILYAAYYNGGVVALDISGTLSGDLSSREIARIQPGGTGNTYMWGLELYNGSLYAIDMLSGLWQLGVPK
ncbi:MAG: LVIVD repeat-containing protein [Gemmatimonadales bacterium]